MEPAVVHEKEGIGIAQTAGDKVKKRVSANEKTSQLKRDITTSTEE
ncbi:hypothetical protein ACJ1_44840 [Pantoea sp. QMID1]|nr:hypothetical protein ACJ1_44840 [Pantoea sp. QMID1]